MGLFDRKPKEAPKPAAPPEPTPAPTEKTPFERLAAIHDKAQHLPLNCGQPIQELCELLGEVLDLKPSEE